VAFEQDQMGALTKLEYEVRFKISQSPMNSVRLNHYRVIVDGFQQVEEAVVAISNPALISVFV
jgi:hypothetical protein